MADHGIVKAIGWNGMGNAAYADDKKLNKSHFHTMGLAIDIDVSHNPYVFTGRQETKKTDADDVKKTKADNNWWMDMFEKHMAYAAKIYGGEKVSAAILNQWAGKMSTDELYAHVAEISKSFKSYMDLAGKHDSGHSIARGAGRAGRGQKRAAFLPRFLRSERRGIVDQPQPGATRRPARCRRFCVGRCRDERQRER